MWLAVHSNYPFDSLEYCHLLDHFGVLRVSCRLMQHDLMFLHGVLRERFDSADILAMFGLAVPARTTLSHTILHVQ